MTDNAKTVWNTLTKDKTGWSLLVIAVLYFGYRDNERTAQYNETISLLRGQLKDAQADVKAWADRSEHLVDKQDERGDKVIEVMSDCTDKIREKDSIINSMKR